MIVGIGIDSVDINRFELWHTFSEKQLLRIFSAEEIEYCLSVPIKSAERFAVRFAAREAFFKAVRHRYNASLSFLFLCKKVKIVHGKFGEPILQVDWEGLSFSSSDALEVFLSLTHTQSVATAMVVLALSVR